MVGISGQSALTVIRVAIHIVLVNRAGIAMFFALFDSAHLPKEREMEFSKVLRFEIASEILAAGFPRDRAIALADEILERAGDEQIARASAQYMAFRYAYSNCSPREAVDAARDLLAHCS